MEKLQEFLIPIAQKLNDNKVIQTISRSLMSLLPALIVGSLGSMLQQIPFEGYQNFIHSTGIYGLTQTLVNVTTNMFAVYVVFAIAYNYVNKEKYNGFTAGVLALISFFIVTPMITEGEGWMAVTSLPIKWLGAQGLFTAMIVSMLVANIYLWFMKNNITIKMPESVPQFISDSFAGILPGLGIGLIFAVIAFIFQKTSFGDVHNAIYSMIGAPLQAVGGSIWAALLIYILSGLCWFFGIHGIAVVSAVIPIWMGADMANVAAISAGGAPTNIITFNWVQTVANIGGAGCTLGLVLLSAFAAKSKQYKEIGKLSLIPSLFNINEPVVFGYPCMLNATLAIPFIFLPVFFVAASYLLTIVGILPVGNGLASPVPMPILMGFFNGGWRMAVWNAIEIVITILAYYPFFKLLDKKAVELENNEKNQ